MQVVIKTGICSEKQVFMILFTTAITADYLYFKKDDFNLAYDCKETLSACI